MNKRTFAVFAVSLMFAFAIVVGVQAQSGGQKEHLAPLPAGASYAPDSDEVKLSDVYEQVTQSVVNINVATQVGGAGTGSGFVIDTDGHIVTNNHVVEDAAYIEVTFVDGTIVPASMVGGDPDSDLAVIRVDPAQTNLVPVTFTDSDEVFVGQNTMAIGSPFGKDFTLTTGIVSALDRSLRNENQFSIPELIQTDAAITPGNSGGPLLDYSGSVIGVNTAILSGTRSASGVGFAIPSNTVRRIVPYLIEQGEYDHSWLGISGTTLHPAQRDKMGLSSNVKGVLVSSVSRNGPAAIAGLQGANNAVVTPLGRLPVGGDIITAVNGESIAQMNDLIAYLESETLPGDTITLTVQRDGSTEQIPITLQERPMSLR